MSAFAVSGVKDVVRHQQQEILMDFIFSLEGGNAVAFCDSRDSRPGSLNVAQPSTVKPATNQVGAISLTTSRSSRYRLRAPDNNVLEDGLPRNGTRAGRPADTGLSRVRYGSENETLIFHIHPRK